MTQVTPAQDALRLRQAADAAADGLPPLLVGSERLANSLVTGAHGRRRAGPGETFWQFRRYGEGDAASAIDWRQSARSNHLFVRETEWEAPHTVFFWSDTSASMDYASAASLETKAQTARVLTLALAKLLVRGGERIALLEGALRPGTGEGWVRRLADILAAGTAVPLGDVPAPTRLPRFSRVVLMSDFLVDLALLDERLRDFGGRGCRGHLVHILDPAEEDLPFTGRTEFEDVEDGASLTIGRAESVRADYTQSLKAHREGLARIANRWGWSVTPHRTDRPARTALAALYNDMAGPRARQMR